MNDIYILLCAAVGVPPDRMPKSESDRNALFEQRVRYFESKAEKATELKDRFLECRDLTGEGHKAAEQLGNAMQSPSDFVEMSPAKKLERIFAESDRFTASHKPTDPMLIAMDKLDLSAIEGMQRNDPVKVGKAKARDFLKDTLVTNPPSDQTQTWGQRLKPLLDKEKSDVVQFAITVEVNESLRALDLLDAQIMNTRNALGLSLFVRDWLYVGLFDQMGGSLTCQAKQEQQQALQKGLIEWGLSKVPFLDEIITLIGFIADLRHDHEQGTINTTEGVLQYLRRYSETLKLWLKLMPVMEGLVAERS